MSRSEHVICPSGTTPGTENVNGTIFVICINNTSKFTILDFIILLFIVLFLIGMGIGCTYFHNRNDENRPKFINGIQLYDSSLERLRDSSDPISCIIKK